MSDLLVPEVDGVTDLVEIGRGGFGVVYRGRQPDLERDVAVKVLMAPGVDERAVERWRREVTAMGRLSNHPNIVGIFSAGVTGAGHPYLVMPYAAGGSLHERVGREGPMAPADAARLGARLAGALAAAHGSGVLHRDVKPANVLLSEYGEPQLSDFGIARLTDSATTTTGSVQATIGYAAPEVLSGEPATPAADVYGLGATLHAALAGEAPFAGPPDEPLMARIGRVVALPPPDLRPLGVPGALAALVERCLAKDPADRPASADALQAELEALAAAPGMAAAAAAPVAPTGPTATEVLAPVPVAAGPERTRSLAALGAVAAVLVVVLAGAGAWFLTRDDGDVTAGSTSTTTTTTSTTEAPPSSSAAAATDPPPSTDGAPTITVPDATEPATDPVAPDAAALREAVATYYGLVQEGDLEASWALLSPGFQAGQSGGYDSYVAYWTETIEAVEVQGQPRPDVEAGTVALTLRYLTTDGRRTTEDVVLTFVTGEDGALLIDAYDVERSRNGDGDGPGGDD